ncbi:ABC transporter ATP-binding protein [Natrarchaeobius sp. A-rgal3]|uniref:ABC transporter ATP-binding protein n=1 Tax=Natrarchaeobius versutus TaxID=1679078 RepID=UPI0035105243
MTNIALESVTKEFTDPNGQQIVAVDDMSFEIADGEMLVLVGPSGCGKTTTLRMVAGLETPTDGTITYDGEIVNEVRARNRDVAMVFQDFALYPHMNVRGNMSFGLKRSDEDYSSGEIDRRVEEAAELLEIADLLDQKPSNLSGGQQQRVALGRAIVRDPRLFLFDEPLANLDEKLQGTMRTEIVELHDEFGVTSVYVTHNQEEAMTVADRIAILNDGTLQQIGEPDEVYAKPSNLFVAQFIGSPSMNLFEGTTADAEGGLVVDATEFGAEIPSSSLVATPTGETVTIGIRPEDLRAATDDDTVRIESTIRVIEPLGRDALVYVDVGDRRVTARIDDYDDLEKGQAFELGVDREHLYLFDGTDDTLVKGKR